MSLLAQLRTLKLKLSSSIPTIIEPSADIVDSIVKNLLKIYQPLPFYTLFGKDAVDYVCKLSARYACWSIPPKDLTKDNTTIEGYALWLSIVWMIDGLCDKYRSLFTTEDVTILGNILTGGDCQWLLSKHPVLKLLFVMTGVVYERYLTLTAKCRVRNPLAYAKINYWLLRYFDTLLDDDKRVFTLPEYREWRLDGGAMMCVVWHLVLLSEEFEPIDRIQADAPFELTSLVVSYHNDLLSLHRDIQQGTPNLATTINNTNYWQAGRAAVIIVENMYPELAEMLLVLPQYVSDICASIAVGSYHWAHSEKRYAKGLAMLQLLCNDEEELFLKQLVQVTEVAGDPTLAK